MTDYRFKTHCAHQGLHGVISKGFDTVDEADAYARKLAADGWDFVTVTNETHGLLGTFAWRVSK